MFDSPQDPTITSGAFSIISPAQVQIPTHTVDIVNGVFVSVPLTVKRGDKIILANHDTIAYPILASSFFPSFTIPAGESYTYRYVAAFSGSLRILCNVLSGVAVADNGAIISSYKNQPIT